MLVRIILGGLLAWVDVVRDSDRGRGSIGKGTTSLEGRW